jgi:hypothetical protein
MTSVIQQHRIPSTNTTAISSILPTTSTTFAIARHYIPQESNHQPPIIRTMPHKLPSHISAQISWKHRSSQISHVLRSCHRPSRRGRRHPRQISHHFSRGCHNKLVLQASVRMNLLLATAQRKVMLNFQGFQVELDTEEDFLSCAQ